MILVTGATGTVGREVVDLLLAAGETVRALSRDPARANLPSGVEVVAGEPSDHESLVAALDGAESVFLVVPGAVGALGEALAQSQTRRAVLLSSLTATTRPELAYARHLHETETVVRQAIPDATLLHPGQFASNVLGWQPMIETGVVRSPFGDVAIPAIDPSDIAAVAAIALRGDDHAGATLTLSGPERLSPRQKAQILADVLGRPIDFAETSEAAFRSASEQMGADLQDYFLALTGSPTPEELELTPTVERVTGRAPRTFADWASRNRLAFDRP